MENIIKNIIEPYFWQGMAVVVAPLFGFAAAQWYKRPETPARNIRAVAGLSTALIASLSWHQAHPDDHTGALIIGLSVGMLQPIIVWIWYQVAKKFTPAAKVFANSGEGDDVTYNPYQKTRIRK